MGKGKNGLWEPTEERWTEKRSIHGKKARQTWAGRRGGEESKESSKSQTLLGQWGCVLLD